MRVAAAPHLERHRVIVMRDGNVVVAITTVEAIGSIRLQPYDVVYMHPDAVEDLRKFSAEERRRLN